MHVEKMIQRIVDNGRQEDMEELSEILEDLMYKLKEYDEKDYKKYEMSLYEMAYGKQLTDEMKLEWVKDMKPMGKWDFQEIEQIYSRYEIDVPIYSFYVVVNLLFSDMKRTLGTADEEEDLIKYIQAAHDWYYDEDATNTEEAKLYAYWKYIVN